MHTATVVTAGHHAVTVSVFKPYAMT
jgi:hypothetical protein